MDKYIKWVIALIILLAITISLIVYFSFFYGSGNASLSPVDNNLDSTNASKGLILDDRGSKDFERPSNSSPTENNTNRSGYWIQNLPDSGGGTYSITPLVIYDELARKKNFVVIIVIVLGIVIYVTFKIRKKVIKK